MKGLLIMTLICTVVTICVFLTQNRTTKYKPTQYPQYYKLDLPTGIIYLSEDTILSQY